MGTSQIISQMSVGTKCGLHTICTLFDVDYMGNVVQEQSRCTWQQGCITHLTQQLASLRAEVTHLKAAQASHEEQALLQTQVCIHQR